MRLAEWLQKVTTFRCKFGAFMFLLMPFGLMNAPSGFQRMGCELFKDMDFV